MPDETPAAGATAPPDPTRKKKGRWLDLALILVGIGCLGLFGLQALRYQRLRPKAPSGKVMAGLTETDRIPAESGAARDFNVLVVTLDTTRADHVGCYGNEYVATPNIDGLARNGVLFEKAITAAPSTLPGHSTIFTGLYPNHHGARANGTYKLQPEQVTLAEILKDAGYTTGAAIGAYVLDSRFGLDQGFDDYNDDLTKGIQHAENSFRERPAEITNEVVFDWLDKNADSKFFFWLHYFDVHAPYMAPEPFRTEYADHPYDGELAYVDQMLGQVLEKLDELGVRDKTLIVVAGDHGESLGEHGEMSHSLLIYDATMHTPLVFSCPTLFSGGSLVRTQVSNVDIVPTVLDLLGVTTQSKFDGVSLLADQANWPKWVYGETIATLVLHGWAPLFFIRHDDYKYIHAPTPEFYDLKNDPGELNNLFSDARYAERIATLSKELDAQIGDDKFGASALQQAVQMDSDTAERMQALGYVATKATGQVDAQEASQFDPKEMIGQWDRVQQAISLKSIGKRDEAIELFEAAVEDVPGDVFTLRLLASAYTEAGQYDKAESVLQQALEIEKHEPGIYTNLATIAFRQRDFKKAKSYIDAAIEVDPNYAQSYLQKGDLVAARGDFKGAEALYRKAVSLDPGTVGPPAYTQMGMMHLRLLRYDKAREAFESALGIDSLHGRAHAGLGSIWAEEGKYEKAREAFTTALRFDPNQPYVLGALAGLYDKLGEFDKAKEAAEKALDTYERLPIALNNLALVMKHTDNMPRAIELFEQALEIQPDDIAARLNLALCYHGMRDDKRAAQQYEDILRIRPGVPIALHNLGKYHESLGRLDRAFDLYTRAVDADPDYAFAHASLAPMLLKRGKVREALMHFKRAIELDAGIAGREQIENEIETLEQVLQNAKPRGEANDGSGTNDSDGDTNGP